MPKPMSCGRWSIGTEGVGRSGFHAVFGRGGERGLGGERGGLSDSTSGGVLGGVLGETTRFGCDLSAAAVLLLCKERSEGE